LIIALPRSFAFRSQRLSSPETVRDAMNVDDLNTLVSEAVRRAELLQDLGSPSARLAWTELSILEQQLAKLHAPTTAEGAFSRRGAVHAALMAHDTPAAERLAQQYCAEPEMYPELEASIKALIEQERRAFEQRFPWATEHISAQTIRELARWPADEGAGSRMSA
jgi:hypothetical protein